MAGKGRDHARIYTAVWQDPDWRKLDQASQHVYWMLTSNKDVSYCGHVDFVPGRWAPLAAGLTEPKLTATIRKLERARYVVVDRKTSELLIRSFIRHDGILARRNMGNACARALGKVHSTTIREAVLHELARLRIEEPEREGWAGFQAFDPDAFDMVCGLADDMRQAMA